MPTEIYNREAEVYFLACLTLTANINRSITYVIILLISWNHLPFMIWYDMIWYDMIWYMIWYDMIWYDMIWYDMIW